MNERCVFKQQQVRPCPFHSPADPGVATDRDGSERGAVGRAARASHGASVAPRLPALAHRVAHTGLG
ncbi:hypothetical protein RR46_05344 [Papilio xuthus]|uniref:Uncharacterized protein n=1 Tax=Papilio xuthus TaxID=66420 RepID=A0A194Q6S8_PAPXU|nr:hypothetical protein RR46_05344 [Papilio xuthus]